VVAEGKIWILGGRNDSTFFSDVWSSENGIDWTQETSSAPWGPRGSHGAVVFNNKIFVIGGWDFDTQYTDVWSLDLTDVETDFEYGYDDLDRLTSVDNSQGIRINYTYDPAGNRLSKETSSVLTARVGASTPQSRGVASNDTQVEVLQIELKGRANSEGANVSGLTFATSGTGDESQAITHAQLWLDSNANGLVDLADPLLAGITPTNDDAPLAITGLGIAIPPGQSRHLLLTYDLSGNGAEGDKFSVKLLDHNSISATGGTAAKNLYVLGTPLDGATVTISTDTTPPVFTGIESAYAAKSSVILGWVKATDNQDTQENIQYAIWISDVPFSGQVVGPPSYVVDGEPADVDVDPTRLYHIV